MLLYRLSISLKSVYQHPHLILYYFRVLVGWFLKDASNVWAKFGTLNSFFFLNHIIQSVLPSFLFSFVPSYLPSFLNLGPLIPFP